MLYDKNPCYDNFDMKFLVAPEHVATFEMALEEFASAVLTMPIEKGEHKGMWEMQAIFETKPDIQDIERAMTFASQMCGITQPKWALNEMEKKNWLKESLISFPPVTIGKYYIYGSHIKDAPPADKIALQIDAATAFGSGEHQTTQGCLTALNELAEKPKKVIDVGCGSGILAMAYAKTFNAPVDAVDIDPESVLVTSNSAKINGLDHLMRIWESDGYKGVNDQYDLVFCNILARPLINMASDLKDHLTSGGMAILSGFLIRQERWVLKAHTDIGLKLVAKYRINGWSTLVVRKD